MSGNVVGVLTAELERLQASESKGKAAITDRKAEKAKLERELKRAQKDVKSTRAKARRVESLLQGLRSRSATPFLRAYHLLFDEKLSRDLRAVDGLDLAIGEEEPRYQKRVRQIKQTFSHSFRDLCTASGLVPVDGDEIRGFRVKHRFRVRINWTKATALIQTLPGGRRNTVKSVEPDRLIEELKSLRDRVLGRDFVPEDFFPKLYGAYRELVRGPSGDILLLDLICRLGYDPDEFSVDLERLLASQHLTTAEGLTMELSPGTEGLTVFDEAGNFKTYKFVRFVRRSPDENRPQASETAD